MSIYRCKQCGKFVAKDAMTCKFCGAEDPTSQPYVPKKTSSVKKSSVKKEEKIMFCPACRQKSPVEHIDNLSTYKQLVCGWCGNYVDNPYYAKTKFDLLKENMGKIVAITLSIIFFLMIVFDDSESSPSYNFEQGQECVFVKDIMGGINEAADDKYVKYAVQKDTYGILELQMEGLVHGALKGDHCVFIRNKSQGRVEVYLKNKRVNILIPRELIRPLAE